MSLWKKDGKHHSHKHGANKIAANSTEPQKLAPGELLKIPRKIFPWATIPVSPCKYCV